jgi:hypothetical protein
MGQHNCVFRLAMTLIYISASSYIIDSYSSYAASAKISCCQKSAGFRCCCLSHLCFIMSLPQSPPSFICMEVGSHLRSKKACKAQWGEEIMKRWTSDTKQALSLHLFHSLSCMIIIMLLSPHSWATSLPTVALLSFSNIMFIFKFNNCRYHGTLQPLNHLSSSVWPPCFGPCIPSKWQTLTHTTYC